MCISRTKLMNAAVVGFGGFGVWFVLGLTHEHGGFE